MINDKIKVKRKFVKALQHLRRMKPEQQRLRTAMASKDFIKDVTDIMKRMRTKPHLVKSKKQKRYLQKHKKSLRRLVRKGSSVNQQRKILLQRGGILPFLIPIILAAVGATGSIGASAVGAAIMKS